MVTGPCGIIATPEPEEVVEGVRLDPRRRLDLRGGRYIGVNKKARLRI